MSKVVSLDIPVTAQLRLAAKEAGAAPISESWLEQLQAHIDAGGLIGEAAGKCLLDEVVRLRARTTVEQS